MKMERSYVVVLDPKSRKNGGTVVTLVYAPNKSKAQVIAEAKYGNKYQVTI
jgi:hypothetical protein